MTLNDQTKRTLKKVLVIQPWGGEAGMRLISKSAADVGLECEFIDIPLPRPRWKSVFGKIVHRYGPSIRAAIYGLKRRTGKDVILCCNPMNGLILAALGRFLHLKMPKIVVSMFLFRNWKPAFMDSLRHVFANYALARVDKIICFSSGEVERYQREFPKHAGKITFVLVGMDPTKLDIVAETGRKLTSDPEPYVFSGGTTNRDYATLSKAMSAFPQIKLKIIGRRLNFPGEFSNLEFLEEVYGPEYDRIMFDSSIVVVPLYNHCFSSGQLTLLTAMELGKAIIASDVPAVRDYIIDGYDGVLVPHEDVGAMTEAIRTLLNDKEERERLGANARMSQQNKFTQEMSQQAIMTIVADVAAASSRNA